MPGNLFDQTQVHQVADIIGAGAEGRAEDIGDFSAAEHLVLEFVIDSHNACFYVAGIVRLVNDVVDFSDAKMLQRLRYAVEVAASFRNDEVICVDIIAVFGRSAFSKHPRVVNVSGVYEY